MISCKEATRLVSLQLERPLGFWVRLQLRLHLAFCIGCRRAEKQFRFLRQAMGSWMSHSD
ncbi:MAG: zf-HC2 domain-containing protein [Azonexus sp.]|nr:zf-HC2 domain-containing protein [Azonexus sp.]